MIRVLAGDAESELDRFVSAFETAHARGAAGDLADFLPDRGHPQYLEILCEIIRIDLEFHSAGCEPRRLDDYRARFPELFDDRQMLEAICFEEYRLRRLAHEAVSPKDYERLYGVDAAHWVAPDSRASVAADRAGEEASHETAHSMPRAGDRFLAFELIRELGRGSFATVFLARQVELADRPVALKVSRERPGESQILARLQHANIVPIHSTHRLGDLRVVCMPYFGATTLADVLRAMRVRGGLPPSGARLVDTLRACRDSSDCHAADHRNIDVEKPPRTRAVIEAAFGDRPGGESATSAGIPAAACLRAIAALDYVEAVVWIASRLAEGLDHAHLRGVLHRDLKPANVLLADDGQPMLLDFNLSEMVRGSADEHVGGTLPYMAPENLAAYWRGGPGGDARGDVYSLGVMLFELLTGRLPFPFRDGTGEDALDKMIRDRREPLPSPRKFNRAVSPAVDAIVRKCLMHDPASRYPSAAALHEDLDRQLRAQPLRHVREPSLRERGAKWLKRHPRATSATVIAALAAILLGLMAAALAVRGGRLAALESAAALANFRRDFRAAQVAALDAPTAPRARLEAIDAACRRALDHFHVLDDPSWPQQAAFRRLPRDECDAARGDVGELLFLLAAVTRLEAANGPAENDRAGIERAVDLNRQAENAWPPQQTPAALWQQRASFAADLGDEAASRQSLARAAAATPQKPRDTAMTACTLVAQRRFRAALPLWQQAVRSDPQSVWTWYGLGNCREQLGQLSEAAACYTACIALKPDYDGWYFSRGAVYLKQKDFSAAAADFDEVLRRRDDQAEARVNRAIARLELGRPRESIDDLDAARTLGGENTRVCLLLARAWDRLGNSDAAANERRCAAQIPPRDEAAFVARAFQRAAADPAAALDDVDRALRLNPYYLPAWESKVHLLAERLDRPDEALAAVERATVLYPESASLVAARGVLFARQSKADAARHDAQAALQLDAVPAVEYQAACIHALLARHDASEAARALELLAAALRGGYGGDLIRGDRDLDAIRSNPQYRRLLQAVDSLRMATAKAAPAGNGPD